MEQDLEQMVDSGATIGTMVGGVSGAIAMGAVYYGNAVNSVTAGGVIGFGGLSQTDRMRLSAEALFGMLPGALAGGITGALTGAAVAAGTYYAVKAYRSLTER